MWNNCNCNMNTEEKSGCGCTSMLVVFIFNIIVGGVSVDYILSWFSKDIPTIADIVIGLFVAEISVPVAIVGWILKLCGVF